MTNRIVFLIALLVVAGSLAAGQKAAPKAAPKPAPKAAAQAVPDFDVEGIGFTECQCTAYACPCRSNGHPTKGTCDAADFAYIKRGHYGNVKLDGLKAVVVGDLIDMNKERRKATVYFDEKTTPEQREAYASMLGFMFGEGMPAVIGAPKAAPIQFAETPGKGETVYTVTIPGILEEKAVLKLGKDGKPANTMPAMDEWGNSIHYVDNVVFKYHDKELGKSWDLSKHQANVKFFHTTKAMYNKKELLAQHGDVSGNWNPKQKEMIQKLGMKAE